MPATSKPGLLHSVSDESAATAAYPCFGTAKPCRAAATPCFESAALHWSRRMRHQHAIRCVQTSTAYQILRCNLARHMAKTACFPKATALLPATKHSLISARQPWSPTLCLSPYHQLPQVWLWSQPMQCSSASGCRTLVTCCIVPNFGISLRCTG
jgi:hypothetical protein